MTKPICAIRATITFSVLFIWNHVAPVKLTPPNTIFAAAIDDANDALLPNGLEVINASYEGESGNAAQMVKLAQTKYADVLVKVPLMGNLSALDIVVEIEAVTPSEIRKRMREWARTVELVLGALARSKDDIDLIQQIRRPMEDAVEKTRTMRLAKQNTNAKRTQNPAQRHPVVRLPLRPRSRSCAEPKSPFEGDIEVPRQIKSTFNGH